MNTVDKLIEIYNLHIGNKQPLCKSCSPACIGTICNLHEQLYLHGKVPFPPAPLARVCADHDAIWYDPADANAAQCVNDYIKFNPECIIVEKPCNPLFCRTFSIPMLLYNEKDAKGCPRWVPPWAHVYICTTHQFIHSCYDQHSCAAPTEPCEMCATGQGACYRECTASYGANKNSRYCIFTKRALPNIFAGAGEYYSMFAGGIWSDAPRSRSQPKNTTSDDLYLLLHAWIESAFQRYRNPRQYALTRSQMGDLIYADLVAPEHFSYDTDRGQMTMTPRDIWSVLACLPAMHRLDIGAVAQPDTHTLIAVPPPVPEIEEYNFNFDDPSNPLLQPPPVKLPPKTPKRDSFIECAIYLYSAINENRDSRVRCSILRILDIFSHDNIHESVSGLRCQTSVYFRKICTIMVHFPHGNVAYGSGSAANMMFDPIEDYHFVYLTAHFPTFFFWHVPLLFVHL